MVLEKLQELFPEIVEGVQWDLTEGRFRNVFDFLANLRVAELTKIYQLRRCISSHSTSSEYVVAAGEPSLDRYLESHLPVVRPTAADEDPWRAHDPRADPALIHTLARILPPSS